MASNQDIMDKLTMISKKIDRLQNSTRHDLHQMKIKLDHLEKTITGQDSSLALLSRIDAYTTYTAALNTYNTAVKYDPSNNHAVLYDCACLLANTANQLSNINENTDIIDNDSGVAINPYAFFELMIAMLTTINHGSQYHVNHPIDIIVLKTSTNVGLQEPSDYFINNILPNIEKNKSDIEVVKDGCF